MHGGLQSFSVSSPRSLLQKERKLVYRSVCHALDVTGPWLDKATSHLDILPNTEHQVHLRTKALYNLGSLSRTPPSWSELLSLLKLCCQQKSLLVTRYVYMLVFLHTSGEELLVPLSAHLVVALSHCGALEDALHIFHRLPCRTSFTWTAIISGFLNRGCSHLALQLYVSMQDDGVHADRYTFVAMFKACGDILELDLGRMLHADARSKGLASDIYSATTLVSMYGKCGALQDAENVFAGVHCRKDIVSWNAMLSAYLEQDEGEKVLTLYAHMRAQGMRHNKESAVIALQACIVFLKEKEDARRYVVLEIVQALHTDLQTSGFIQDTVAGTALIHAYSKCDALREAEMIFHDLPQPDVVPWTAMLLAYVEHHEGESALQLYGEMQKRGICPNERTVVCAIQACCVCVVQQCNISEIKAIALEVGKAIHADARKQGFLSDVFVCNALISLYRNYMAVADAVNVLCDGLQCDVVSWTTLISLYVEQGDAGRALQVYRLMHTEGVSPNHHTIVASIQACGILAQHGKLDILKETRCTLLDIIYALHAEAHKKGVESDIFICSALVKTYGNCGNLAGAESVFKSLIKFSIVAWNAMLSAYIEQGQELMALQLYRQMTSNRVPIDVCTFVCVLQGCSKAGNAEICMKLHFDVLCAGFDVDSVLTSSLLYAYGCSRAMDDAEAVAYAFPQLDVVSWNACVSGYPKEGQCEGIIKVFEQMQLEGNIPTESSLTSVLSACSHAGLIAQGLKYFESMSSVYNIAPELKHYVNVVELLGRAGDFRRVRDVLVKMPMQPDATVYLCLLGVCFIHGSSSELGKLGFLNFY